VEELEKKIASYVGKPEAMVFGMGYATNSTTLPALAGKVRSFTDDVKMFIYQLRDRF
jgi:7-keto-8-aminopelargonate synthetase-like enzyme